MRIIGKRRSICSRCLKPSDADVCATPEAIYLRKSCRCDADGTSSPEQYVQISSDPKYFLASNLTIGRRAYKPRLRDGFSTLIIEITDDCNLSCPTCIAGSHPGAGNYKSLRTIRRMIKQVENVISKPDILMISGGEPTIHPNILDVLKAACNSSINRIMLITNGVRLSEDRAFAESLSEFDGRLEVYLQFDSLERSVLCDIRGLDLSDVRQRAVSVLDQFKIPTTLVCVVKRGINDHLCADVINYALSIKSIKGVTFQPIKAAGRTDSLKPDSQLIDLATVRRQIIDGKVGFHEQDLIPHPLCSENICVGYLERTDDGPKPVTRSLLRGRRKNGEYSISEERRKCLFVLPSHNSARFHYSSLFRVAIISFMDKYNFCQELIKYEPIGFVLPNGDEVPLDTYYMFGRGMNSVQSVMKDHARTRNRRGMKGK